MQAARLTSGSLVMSAFGASCVHVDSLAFEGGSYSPCGHIPPLHIQ